MVFLVEKFQTELPLLERRGTLALRRLCVLLGAERVYRELATILQRDVDIEFATIMVQALNLILLTASELSELRELLKQSLSNSRGADLFVALYSSWCHSPMATVSLCLLAQAYQHASAVIQALGELDINVKFLVQVDKLVRLLETPIFTYMRLQLLEPARYPALLKSLYGILMLLPQQSTAFKILRTRLKTVPAHTFMQIQTGGSDAPGQRATRRASSAPHNQIITHIPSLPIQAQFGEDGDMRYDGDLPSSINFATRLNQFQLMQHQHRLHRLAQLQASNQGRKSLEALVQKPEEASDRTAKGQLSYEGSFHVPQWRT
ncbi:hypothetical protein O6H91_Y347800 [Diphasiastrum complanatum]|nr:hypothetical protein O6H91_Y347800 [Diphasiastrum complanatum]